MYIGACCPPVVSTGDAALDAAEEVDELCVSSGESDVVPDDGVDVMDLANYWDVKRLGGCLSRCRGRERQSPESCSADCHCVFAS